MSIFRRIILTSILFQVGCPKPPVPPTPGYKCIADPSWITAPQQPNEIAKSETFCDFYQFSWQWFLAQTSLSTTNSQERVFERQNVYLFDGTKNQCSLEDNIGRSVASSSMQQRVVKSDQVEDIQADRNAMYDRDGNVLYYNIWYADQNCMATEKGFDSGTMEIKGSWMKLEAPSLDYFWIETQNENTESVYYGLVGFHMSIFTKNHPEMIWATWEHKKNAPNCNGTSAGTDWNFTSEKASQCLIDNKSVDACSEFNFNTPTQYTGHPPTQSTPNNICRVHPYGNESGESVNGNDNADNLESIIELNEQLVGKDGFITSLSDKNPMKVWSNYEMIGGLWTKDGQASGNLPVPHKGGEPDPESPQRGSLYLANTSMETFEQSENSYVPNCFGCHQYNPEQPLNVSHIQQNLIIE